jgi:hypothetical protein
MLQPAICHFGDQTMEPGTSRPVAMNFAGGSKKQFVLTKLHNSSAESLFALSCYNKTDASPIVNVVGKDKTRTISAGEDPTIRNILNTKNFSVVGWSK